MPNVLRPFSVSKNQLSYEGGTAIKHLEITLQGGTCFSKFIRTHVSFTKGMIEVKVPIEELKVLNLLYG